MIKTEAWVLYPDDNSASGGWPSPAKLRREAYEFPAITHEEVLVEPLYGCWEGNMTHALDRDPVDICRQRHEAKVVIGNAGVVRIVEVGAAVEDLKPGDLCLVFCNGVWDEYGYPIKIYAYDAPGSVGLLARQTKLHHRQLILIPENTRHTLAQWAAFSLRYITAWANWKVAHNCWRVSRPETNDTPAHVWGWGGGVAFAETALAAYEGHEAALISSKEVRLKLTSDAGIRPIDRRLFSNLSFDPEKYKTDAAFRQSYQEAEDLFIKTVREYTNGEGVSIFIDFIGMPVLRATLKALRRPGVITTAGWKEGMHLSTVRAIECMNWHTHVHTHYARYDEGIEAVRFAEETGWLPPRHDEIYDWNDIPQLAEDYSLDRCNTYFPLFRINSL